MTGLLATYDAFATYGRDAQRGGEVGAEAAEAALSVHHLHAADACDAGGSTPAFYAVSRGDVDALWGLVSHAKVDLSRPCCFRPSNPAENSGLGGRTSANGSMSQNSLFASSLMQSLHTSHSHAGPGLSRKITGRRRKSHARGGGGDGSGSGSGSGSDDEDGGSENDGWAGHHAHNAHANLHAREPQENDNWYTPAYYAVSHTTINHRPYKITNQKRE